MCHWSNCKLGLHRQKYSLQADIDIASTITSTIMNSVEFIRVLRRTGIARTCMHLLKKWIWMSSIRLRTKTRFYKTWHMVWVKTFTPSLWGFLKILLQRLRIFKRNFTRLFYVCSIQLSLTLTKLCQTKGDRLPNFYLSLPGWCWTSEPPREHSKPVIVRYLPVCWHQFSQQF